MAIVTRTASSRARKEQATPTPLRLDRSELGGRLAGETFDILVIGGGITGAYTAFDAALRGYKAALIEKDDFASGTSSKSTKMVHGGIRYLEQGNVRLVRHSLLERQRFRENAPHLVHRLPLLFPVMTENGIFDRRLELGFEAILRTYDWVGGWREGVLHSKLSREETIAQVPTMRPENLIRSYLCYDARADDARLTLAIVRSAAAAGAVVVNYAKAVEITRSAGKVTGAVVQHDGAELTVKARVVVMATGSWLRDWNGAAPDADAPTVRPAKGVHIAVPWLRLRNSSALTVPVPGQKTRATIVRWDDSILIGTTDDDYTGDLDVVGCTARERDLLLSAINQSFDVDLSAADVTGSIAGTRPLVAKAASGRTSEVPRNHEIRIDHDGLVSVVGGKLTTARHMAQQTVDAAQKVLGSSRRCRTVHEPLLGAAGYDAASATSSGGLETHLAGRYGTEARFVAALIAERPSLATPLVAGQPYLEAEVIHAVRHELACTVDDVLARRTRARLFARDASALAAARTAELMGDELGWSQARRDQEVADYQRAIRFERDLLEAPATPDPEPSPSPASEPSPSPAPEPSPSPASEPGRDTPDTQGMNQTTNQTTDNLEDKS